MLKSIRIQRFKSISDATLSLERVTVLVGPNNAGKSSVLQAIQFGVSITQSLHLDGSGRWTGRKLGGTLSSQQLVYTPLRDVHALASSGVLRQSGNAISITYSTDDLGTADVTVARGKNKNIAVTMTGKPLLERLQDLDNPYSVVAPGLAGIPSMEEFKSQGIVTRAAARGDANSVFRNVLWALKQDAARWSEFQDAIAEIFPGMAIDVQFNDKTDEHITATTSAGSLVLPIDSAGTGLLQAIQVLAYIGLYQPRLLILDEPDSHLHPDNQRKLARLLTQLAERLDFQVLISTHSRHFVDEFVGLGAGLQWFSGGEARDGAFDQVKVLLDLGALDAGDRLRNGATPLVVITEDSDHEYLRAILESSGLTPAEYNIWEYKGSSQVGAAVVLSKFIKDHAAGTHVLVHRDRDYLSDAEMAEYVATVESAGATCLVPDGTDIESIVLRPDHVLAVYPELDASKVRELLEQATEATQVKSRELIITARQEAANRRRNRGGPSISAGQVSLDAIAEYDANPERFRHGKRTLKALNGLIQGELGQLNRRIAQPSSALRVAAVESVVARIRT